MVTAALERSSNRGRIPEALGLLSRILLLAIGLSAPLAAQPATDSTPTERITLEELEAAKARIEANADGALEEAIQAAALRHLEPAIEFLQASAQLALEVAELVRETNDIPPRIEAITRELAGPPLELEIEAAEIAKKTAIELETDLERFRATQKLAKTEQTRLTNERTNREVRRGEIATRLAAINQDQVAVADTLRATVLEPDAGIVEVAARWEALARREFLSNQVAALEAERASLEARRALLPLRIQRGARRVAMLDEQVNQLNAALTEKKKENAKAQERAATEKRKNLESIIAEFPRIGELAKENETLSARLTGKEGLLLRTEEMRKENDSTRRDSEETRRAFRSVLEDVKWIGLSDRVGQNLREELIALDNPGAVGRKIELLGIEYGETQYELKVIEERLEETTAAAQLRLAELFPELTNAVSSNLEADARAEALVLLQTQRDLLEDIEDELRNLSTEQRAHLEALADKQQITRVFRAYIEERVLWVASVLTPPEKLAYALKEGIVWGFGGIASPTVRLRGVDRELGSGAPTPGTVPEDRPEARATGVEGGESEWTKGAGRLLDDLRNRWLLAALFAIGIGLLFAARPVLCRKSAFFGEKVRHYSTDSLQYTWGEIAITVLLALPLPALFLGAGLLLSARGQVPVAIAVGQALIGTAGAIFVVQLLFQTLRPKGLAEGHFRWPTATVTVLRRKLRTWMAIIIPALFVVLLYAYAGIQSYSDTVGRLAFTVLVVACTIFTWRTLRPHGPALGTYIDRNPNSLIYRLRVLWFPLIACGPAVLGIAAAAGYYYTALELGSSALATVVFVLALVFVHAFLLRWLFAARRRLAVEVARARAKAREEERAADSTPSEGGESADDDDEVDIPSLDAQTKQIFRAGLAVALGLGLYLIWADKLPALHVLERIEIYPSVRWVPTDLAESSALVEYQSILDGPSEGGDSSTGANGGGEATSGEKRAESSGSEEGVPPSSGSKPIMTSPLPGAGGATEEASGTAADAAPALAENVISLADLGLAILILFFMVVASRNLPGLMEFSILQRLPLDRGARYAISTIVRYLIVIIGTTIAFSAIGIGWARLQWLAAAFTFGLAFGLQEIFANFVSGLIILIERPVRVGDVVTVAGIEGRVTRLQMRSTTIQDWERREFLVPNKEFITGSLLNWTLSDPVSRIVITVGVAYGSDVRLAEKLLLETARNNKHVLTDPAPNVVFRQFGESTLDFELRLFIAHREQWASVTNQANFAIDAAFREAKIEIAFPQRDLHIRSGLEAIQEPKTEPTPSE